MSHTQSALSRKTDNARAFMSWVPVPDDGRTFHTPSVDSRLSLRRDAVLRCNLYGGAAMPVAAKQPILVKRYARSRLYDTQNQSYVSVEQLRAWADDGVAFSVIDTETNTDVTAVLLA